MTATNVVTELTQLYTNKVQRIIHYQKFSQEKDCSHKIKEIIEKLVEEEREHLQILSLVIIKLLNGEDNSEIPSGTAKVPPLQQPLKEALLKQIKEKDSGILSDYNLPNTTDNNKNKTDSQKTKDTKASSTNSTAPSVAAKQKKQKPLVWTFGRSKSQEKR